VAIDGIDPAGARQKDMTARGSGAQGSAAQGSAAQGSAAQGSAAQGSAAQGSAARRPQQPARPAGLARASGRLQSGWPALTGLALGALALGPGLARGFLLDYDMVFVPRPPFSAALLGLTGGPPRAVPSDTVVAVLAQLMPADILQKLILLSIFGLACSGAAGLVSAGWRTITGERAPLLAALAAGVFYTWNPFVAERLLIGQWALLLGYAGLPWALRVLCTDPVKIRAGRLCLAILPAAIGGFAPMVITAIATIPAALARGRGRMRATRLATVLAVVAVASLPWAIPALLVPVHTDPLGAQLFHARADTPFGGLGSLVMLSGIWNPQTVPRGYGGAASAVWLAVVLAAIAGYALRARPARVAAGAGWAGLAGLLVAAIGLTPAGRAALSGLVADWPGFAILRDGQEFVAPLALTEAIGIGTGVGWLLSVFASSGATERRADRPGHPSADLAGPARTRAKAPSAAAAVPLAVMAVVAPVLLLPGMAWGLAGRLHPVQYPADWLRAGQIIDGDPRPGSALLLPWGTYRNYAWNDFETVYDPWSRLLHREVIFNDGLQVGNQHLLPEGAASIRMNAIVTKPGPLTRALESAGVRYVIVDSGPLLDRRARGLAERARLPGAVVLIASRDLVIFLLPLGRL
jgi:hypothetical protein